MTQLASNSVWEPSAAFTRTTNSRTELVVKSARISKNSLGKCDACHARKSVVIDKYRNMSYNVILEKFGVSHTKENTMGKGKASNSIATFQNGSETVLSGARGVFDDVYLTVSVPLDEEHQPEQTEAIKKLLSDAVVSNIIPQITLFGEMLSKDVAFETDGSYMQLQNGENTVLISEFKQNIDMSILSKTITLPSGLALKYGNIKDSKTGYVPFITTVGEHKYKFLATNADTLQGMFVTAAN